MPLEQMDFPASYEALRPVVEHEYFDHRAVPQLEEYLDEQVSLPCLDGRRCDTTTATTDINRQHQEKLPKLLTQL